MAGLPVLRSAGLYLLIIYVVLQLTILSLHKMYNTANYTFAEDAPIELSRSDFQIDLDLEVKKGLAYARSITSTKRKLLFVHIPKAAGTTIEEVGGLQAKAAWGSCLFNHRPKRPGGVCKYPPGQFEWPTKIGYWHLPTQLFPLMGINPYENADLFAVIREPMDRLLSEFYYICRKEVNKNWKAVECDKSRIHDSTYLNEWIYSKIGVPANTTGSHRMTPEDYLDHNGHFTPQYDFLVSRMAEIRMVDCVLRMDDSLEDDFATLMEAYDIPAAMPPHKRNAARNETHDLVPNHYDAATLAAIERKYREDLDLFR